MPERGQAFQALRESSVREVSAAGFDFRYAAVSSSDLVLVTSDYTLNLQIDARELARVRAIKDPVERLAAAEAASADWHNHLSPEELRKKVVLMEQLCCASIRAFRVTGAGTDFDPVQFVMSEAEETDISAWKADIEWQQVMDRKRPAPRLWIGRLPKPCVEEMFGYVWNLSGDDGRAEAAIANFRPQPRGHQPHRRDRAPKRKVGA